MTQLKKCILSILLVLTLTVGSSLFFEPKSVIATGGIEYDFNDPAELSDFSPFFIQEEAGTNGQLETLATRWETGDSLITSQRSNSGSGSTGNIAMLTLNKYLFTNFEAVVVMNFVGDSSWGWGGISFRQSGTGNGWRADGCLAFVQKEGYATLWGNENFDDTTIEGNKPTTFSKSTPFVFKVRVVGTNATVSVMNLDQTVTYSTINYTFKKSAAVTAGYISLVSVDNSHAFDRLSITPLDASGNVTAPTAVETVNTIAFPQTAQTIKIGEAVRIDPVVTPTTMDYSDLVWTSSNESVAIVKNGCLTGLKEGTVSVIAHSAFSLDIAASMEVTVTGKVDDILRTDFSAAESLQKFVANYVRTSSDLLAGNESVNDHWLLTENQTLIRTHLLQGANSDENVASLILAGKEFSGFEATLVYRNTDSEYGWVGITSGGAMMDKRFMDDGQGFFIQREGIATIWGKNIGGPYEKAVPHYDIAGWHILKVKAYGKKVEIYLDDLLTPCYQKTLSTAIQSGDLGLVTSGRATFEIASFTAHYLDSDGDMIDIGSITGLVIEDKISTAAIGDSWELNVGLLPNSLDGYSYSVSTSNGNIAFFNGNTLHFIGSGTVTINVVSDFDPLIADSMTIEVSDQRSQEHHYYYVTTEDPDPVDDDPKTGCQAGITELSAICFSGLVLLGMIFLRKKY